LIVKVTTFLTWHNNNRRLYTITSCAGGSHNMPRHRASWA